MTVLDEYAPEPSPIHAVLASTRMLPARVRSFLDFVQTNAAWEFRLPGAAGLG